jgi:hypothetical protein
MKHSIRAAIGLALVAAPAAAQLSAPFDQLTYGDPVGLSADGAWIVTNQFSSGLWSGSGSWGVVQRGTGAFIDIGAMPPAGGWGPTSGGFSGYQLGNLVEVSTGGNRVLARLELADTGGPLMAETDVIARWDTLLGWQFTASLQAGCEDQWVRSMSSDGSVLALDAQDGTCTRLPSTWLPDARPDPTQVSLAVFDVSETECAQARCISGDGNFVGGVHSKLGCNTGLAPGDVQQMAAVWDRSTGLPVFPGEGLDGAVFALSHDGSVAVGRQWNATPKRDAVVWDMTTTPPTAQYLGLVSPSPSSFDQAEARTVSPDGDLATGAFGSLVNPYAPPGSAFYWKRHVNGSVATQRLTPMAQRISQAGDAFPQGPSATGGNGGDVLPTSVATEVRDTGGPNGNAMIYNVQTPGALFFGTFGWPYVIDVPLLEADTDHLDLTNGGPQVFSVDAGPSQAGQLYLLLGSATGDAPGWVVGPRNQVPIDTAFVQAYYDAVCATDPNCTPPGTIPTDYSQAGDMTLPLAFDSYFLSTATTLFGLWPVNSFGFLDASGRPPAAPLIGVPAGQFTSLAGATLYHAYVVLDVGDLSARAVSNAVPVDLVL